MFYKEHPDIEGLSEQQVSDIRHEVQITIKGTDIPRPILEFGHCGFPEKCMNFFLAFYFFFFFFFFPLFSSISFFVHPRKI
jgi:hypothetical protein